MDLYDKSTVEEQIASHHLDRAIEMLDHNIEYDQKCPLWWYLRGKIYWRLGRRANAISDYEEAAHIDPSSPAVQALQMTRDIMDYYNTDLLNP